MQRSAYSIGLSLTALVHLSQPRAKNSYILQSMSRTKTIAPSLLTATMDVLERIDRS